MRVRLFTYVYVYGSYLELLKRTAVSVNWPLNRQALEGSLWSIYTQAGDEARVREILQPLGIELEFHHISVSGNIGLQLTECLGDELKLCLQKDGALLLVAPDTIFDDGTLQTLVRLGSEGMNVISVPHARVLSSTFPDLKEPTSNANLVRLAIEHMHEVWKLSNITLQDNNAFLSGVGWREIRPNLYAVTMRIPTPYFVRPTQNDIERLTKWGAGAWDHKWPDHLVGEQRHRIIGSSDAAFMVELSRGDIPQGGTKTRNRTDPDEYRGCLQHHLVNRNTLAIWRAEES